MDLNALWPTMLRVARNTLRQRNGHGLASDPEELAGLVALALLRGTKQRDAISASDLRRLTNCRATDLIRWATHNGRGSRHSPVDLERVEAVLVAYDDRPRREAIAERLRLVFSRCTRGQRRVLNAYLRHGSMTTAAEALGCSLATVSVAIKAVRERNRTK